jgi:hypothetical protein
MKESGPKALDEDPDPAKAKCKPILIHADPDPRSQLYFIQLGIFYVNFHSFDQEENSERTPQL